MAELKFSRKVRIKRYRKLAIFFLMLFSLWIGYKLASYETQSLNRTISAQSQTILALNTENHNYVTQYNQTGAQQLLCDAELQVNRENLKELTTKVSSCQEEIALYKYVIAPELSGNLLSVDLVSITDEEQPADVYQLDLVLLQPRLQKGVINGELTISVLYSDKAPPVFVTSVPYRFKFFQQVSIDIALPRRKIPHSLVFSSKVYQYKRFKEDFSLEIDWDLKKSHKAVLLN